MFLPWKQEMSNKNQNPEKGKWVRECFIILYQNSPQANKKIYIKRTQLEDDS
jgi:hypothetical protein